MATIKPIEGRTVHQIQSGQVIVDLCSVVKELVENSLDAGATSIDVRFKNQGLDSIEVQDNGGGVSPNNYETLALKHHTSKLSTYSDLTTLQTFGFRGEALSSLCALSRFSVITCLPEDAPKGTRLEFEVSGKLKGTSVVAAQKGTTVLVEGLFHNLPVRRRELERNIKREWNKVTGVLGQYACIQTGIKFTVSQQAGKGKKTTIFSTKGNQSTRENIVNVFGAKTLTALVPLDLILELEATSAPSQRWNTQNDGGNREIRIVGHISRPAYGDGRQTPDRQMFFVNSRPCGLPQVAKAFNEVYKSYNASQSPFIFANIELDTHLYDVNVSPDKRTILLHDQNRMLESLKEALTALFESQDYKVPISQLPAQKQPSYKQLVISREATVAPSSPALPTPKSPKESTPVDESEDSAKIPIEKSTDDDEGSNERYYPEFKRGAISRESVGKVHERVSLTSKWVGRKAETRANSKIMGTKSAGELKESLSNGKRRLVEKLRGKGDEAQAVNEQPNDPESSFATTQPTDTEEYQHRPFAPVLTLQERRSERAHSDASEEGRKPNRIELEASIPALQSPPRPPASIAQRFSNAARTQRSSAETAIITIGDQTITSSVGTPGPKRARSELGSTWRGKTHSPVVAKTSPSFGNSLSQNFAAPGTALQSASSNEEIEDIDEDDEDDDVGVVAPDHHLLDTVSETSENSPEDAEQNELEKELSNKQSNELIAISSETNSPAAIVNAQENDEYFDESEKKALEDAKVEEMIQQAENSATIPSEENLQRTKSLLKGGSKKKDATVHLARVVNTNSTNIGQRFRSLENSLSAYKQPLASSPDNEGIDAAKAEEKLSLTISKTDFAKMRVVGQFNLGFILATRTSNLKSVDNDVAADDLFIIDQHASDEKYNFERLQATTIVQSQRLVQPKTLDLTAMEEEIVIENLASLEHNGFIVEVDQSGESPVGQRCQLISLPLSRETAFSLSDLEELISLLADHPPGSYPRPSKVRKMFAMRACRSSIMIGKTLTYTQMGRVVKHLGELDKPWNCPHGRPTMRHLCGLGVWDDSGWKEGYDGDDGDYSTTNWAAYVRRNQRGPEILDDIEDE